MKKIVIATVLVLLIVSCGLNRESVSPTLVVSEASSADNCLSPEVNFMYPLGENDLRPTLEEVLPPVPWKQVVQIPGDDDREAYELMAIRLNQEEDEIWVANTLTHEFKVYRPKTNTWIDAGRIDALMGALFMVVDHQGGIWVAAPQRGMQWIYRYQSNPNQFETVLLDMIGWDSGEYITDIQADSQGTLWFLIGSYSARDYSSSLAQPSAQPPAQLYSYNTQTFEVKHHPLEFDLMNSLVVFPDDSIGLISKEFKETHWSNGLIRYFPTTGAIEEYFVYDSIYEYRHHDQYPPRMFLDNHQRLWFDDRGWAEFSAGGSVKWQAVIPSAVFIDILEGQGLWYWGHPRFSAVGADGKLWYSSSRGSGWVDTEQGKWCVFTSYNSNVLADSQGNLWILVDDWLYRLEQ